MARQREIAEVLEVAPEATGWTYSAFCVLREGRAIMDSPEEFLSWVNEKQRPDGYRIVGAFLPGKRDAVAAAGFRVHCMLSRGLMLYVDDLVTMPEHRSSGYAGQVFDWLVEEGRRLGCERLHLDSGHQRYDAHRFYLKHGMKITAHHFSMALD
ncbi:MAG: GNAT family N-acetyltransferase [Acidobacteriaceae bacterium]